MSDIEKQLKDAWKASGLSIKQLADKAGVYYSAAHGFLVGERDLGIRNAAKLARALDLELTPRRPSKRKGK